MSTSFPDFKSFINKHAQICIQSRLFDENGLYEIQTKNCIYFPIKDLECVVTRETRINSLRYFIQYFKEIGKWCDVQKGLYTPAVNVGDKSNLAGNNSDLYMWFKSDLDKKDLLRISNRFIVDQHENDIYFRIIKMYMRPRYYSSKDISRYHLTFDPASSNHRRR